MKKFNIYLLVLFLSISALIAKDAKVEIDVYYFHATARCQGCLKIEDYTFSSINKNYEKELKNGSIKIQSIDFLEPENEKYQTKYGFDTQALIISKKVDGREVEWKNLDKIWDYSNSFKKYEKYVKKEINKLLK